MYNYDLAGNRVKRFLNCDAHNPWENPASPAGPLIGSVTPNPTPGGVIVDLSSPVPFLKFAVSDMGGSMILEQSINQETSSFSFDISSVVPGSYLITVWALDQVDGYTIIKM
ncbi:MAG: T9SS type A sorting domain-containing protein [Chitinophagaceae bacterium]